MFPSLLDIQLDIPVTDDALRLNLGKVASHSDAELIARASIGP